MAFSSNPSSDNNKQPALDLSKKDLTSNDQGEENLKGLDDQEETMALDRLLQNWPYAPEEVAARKARGADGRDLVLLRIDLGLLQLEVIGRPDGNRPNGYETYYDLLVDLTLTSSKPFILSDQHCNEIDREFVQYYHRRVAWLALKEFDRAISDANHTLALMDFSTQCAPSDEWVELHEQYRPFVLFHRIQAETLNCLAHSDPERSLLVITEGITCLRQVLDDLSDNYLTTDDLVASLELSELEEQKYSFVSKLEEMKSSIMTEYGLKRPLADQLAAAIEGERYELAAELRDRISTADRNS